MVGRVTAAADLSVTPVALELLACLKTEIAKVAKPPKNVSLRTGPVVALLLSTTRDECCEGVAWVRVANVFPSSRFPNPDDEAFPEGPMARAALLELGAARCAPTPPANRIPTSAEWDAVSMAVLDDAAAMWRAICCWAGDRLYLPGLWEPLPVEGGCLGGTQQLTVPIGDCDNCDPVLTDPGLDAFIIPGMGEFLVEND